MTKKRLKEYSAFGLTACADTMAEAKADVEYRLTETVHYAERGPYVFAYAGHTVVLWYTGTGFAYTVVTPDTAGRRTGGGTYFGKGTSYAEAVRSAHRHLAQYLIGVENTHKGMDVLEHPEDRRDHLQYLSWQCAWRAYMSSPSAQALSVEARRERAHVWASEHQMEYLKKAQAETGTA